MSAVGDPLRFSVIVASRGRGRLLCRTLKAIRQLDYPTFEVIVVGDGQAGDAVQRCGLGWVRFVGFEDANLSEARNLGIAHAGGEVCAFIDDDAVPEPMWLVHHETALKSSGAAASCGYVRGPDGIGYQSRGALVDREGETHPLIVDGDLPFVPETVSGQAVKLVGTNMVIRRPALLSVGGFDPAYRYYLEDADVSIRLAKAGSAIAVAPLAEVHHALAESSLRTGKRVPRSLFEIGRSTAIYLRRHPGADTGEIRQRTLLRERRRLERALVRGMIEPRDVAPLLATLADGWRDGTDADLPTIDAIMEKPNEFQRVETLAPGHAVFVSRFLGRRRSVRRALDAMNAGNNRASVFSFSLTLWPRLVRYTDDGVWLHSGGQFRKPGIGPERVGWCRIARCVSEEIGRVAKQRGLNDAEDLLSARAANL